MIHVVSRNGDTIDEGDAIGESIEDIRLHQRLATPPPAREPAKGTLNFQI
jgi:hypothetical protein